MNHIKQKIYNEDQMRIVKLDDFSLDKNQFFLEKNKKHILFSELIKNKKYFKNRNLLDIFPDVVIATLQEEFERPLDGNLVEILIEDFNLSSFEEFFQPENNYSSSNLDKLNLNDIGKFCGSLNLEYILF